MKRKILSQEQRNNPYRICIKGCDDGNFLGLMLRYCAVPLDRCNGFVMKKVNALKSRLLMSMIHRLQLVKILTMLKKFDSEDCPESTDCCATINELEANAEVMFGRSLRRLRSLAIHQSLTLTQVQGAFHLTSSQMMATISVYL